MTNTFLKLELISRTAPGLLRRELIPPRLVPRLGIDEFRGAKNDTVNVRVPARLTADRDHRALLYGGLISQLRGVSVTAGLDRLRIHPSPPHVCEQRRQMSHPADRPRRPGSR